MKFKLLAIFLFLIFQKNLNKEYSTAQNVLIGIGTLGTYPLYKTFWEKTNKEILDEAYKIIDAVKKSEMERTWNKQAVI